MKAVRVSVILVSAILGMTGLASASQVRETFEGRSGKQVYILEDIHGDFSTQMSHVRTISALIGQKDLSLLATEGAAGYLSSLPLQIGSAASSNAMANALLEKNQINAAHLMNTVAAGNLVVVGVENKKDYEHHLEIARQIQARSDAVQAELEKITVLALSSGEEGLIPEIETLKKYTALKASRSQVEEWKELSPACRLEKLLARLSGKGVIDPALLREQMKAVENYYAMALKRDLTLVSNTLERMELEGVETAALIVGGFHTDGITSTLRENQISYTVISPN